MVTKKNIATLIKASALFVVLNFMGGCGQKEIENKEPSFPYFSTSQIADMSNNERQELERRCLGLKNETCDNLKSKEVQSLIETKVGVCKLNAISKNMFNPYQEKEDDKKCEQMR